MDARTQARRKIELALKNALPRDEFELFYQPIVNLKTNQITSFEALLRWHHPERGLILPTEFVPVAEEIGLIAPIGDWVIYQSCKEAATWPEHLKVAINLSPAHLARSNIIALITGALAAARLGFKCHVFAPSPDSPAFDVVHRVTCADYLALPPDRSEIFSAWMSGWFNQKMGTTYVNFEAYERNVESVKAWCGTNPNELVMTGLQRATGK